MSVLPPGGGLPRPGPRPGIAEDLVLLGYDPVTGRPRIPLGTLRAAAAGGLLADLLLSGHLQLTGGRARIPTGTPLSLSRAHRVVHRRLREHPDRDVDHWVTHLDTVADLVAAGLVRSGLLRQVRVRQAGSWWRRTWALTPGGPGYSRWRTRDLGLTLTGNTPLTGRTLALAGLIDASGLLPVVVHAAGLTSVTDLSTITPVRARLRHAFHAATTPDLAIICAAVKKITDAPSSAPPL